MIVEIYHDNLYCFFCRRHMVEHVEGAMYYCECRSLVLDPFEVAAVDDTFLICPSCAGNRCHKCADTGLCPAV